VRYGDIGTSDQFKEWPPCLKHLLESGIPEGGRNTTMFAVGTACKLVDPDNWKTLHEKINTQYCQPPLPASEIVTIQQQLEKKEYFLDSLEEAYLSLITDMPQAKTLDELFDYWTKNVMD